jgi:hypothetical protein
MFWPSRSFVVGSKNPTPELRGEFALPGGSSRETVQSQVHCVGLIRNMRVVDGRLRSGQAS